MKKTASIPTFLALRIFSIRIHLPTSTPFPIRITSIQHTNILEDSQRHFPFSALQTFSISCGRDLRTTLQITSSCLQYPMRGRVSPIKVHASDTLPFISCGGEFHLSRFKHLILRLCFILPALSILYGEESPIQKFTHLILRLCFLDFQIPCL